MLDLKLAVEINPTVGTSDFALRRNLLSELDSSFKLQLRFEFPTSGLYFVDFELCQSAD
jgi:hypothetical protein